MRTILAGAATLAFAATIGVLPTTAFAAPGGGHQNGNGKSADNGPAMKQDNSAKNDKSNQGLQKRPQKDKAANGPAMKAAQAAAVRGNGNNAKSAPDNRTPSATMKPGKPDKAQHAAGNSPDRGNSGKAMSVNKAGGNNGARGLADRNDLGGADASHPVRRVTRIAHIDRTINHGLIDGCPPGLAKKGTGCTPPGQLNKRPDTWHAFYNRPSWWGYDRLSGNDYRYDNGYLYRISGDSILGYIPLLGGALSIGSQWPSYYRQTEVPGYYADYYNLGQPDAYRYADNVLYRVDPGTQAITSIAALLTGDEFNVGQPMPAGYGVYNVPYAYQDRYYDSPDAHYRYADGYVYQVDPKTRLITAAIELLS
ncbi:hypothetical protein IDJ81_07610 [Tsuneonella flava]|uniref:Uncharacterized protein n=1 Tax=Tsuneonella flava TaxID=2055955 RepID=A0ABX7K5T9_9SPHN|nr:hypothetical protein [Tsuneonella flava]QSB43288.1 hypothetical protein IDJ81_07610 [Tsuneonella flava]